MHTFENDENPKLITTLWHESGEYIRSDYALPQAIDPKDLASAITYGRRYCVCAMLSIAAEGNDDGDNAPPINSNERTYLMDVTSKQFSELGWKSPEATQLLQAEFGVNHRSQLSIDQMRELKVTLEKLLITKGE